MDNVKMHGTTVKKKMKMYSCSFNIKQINWIVLLNAEY